jgi:hypothetical protein
MSDQPKTTSFEEICRANLQVTAEAIIKLKGQYTKEGKESIKEYKNILGPERYEELTAPPNWIAALTKKVLPKEEVSDDVTNKLGPTK